MPNNEVSHHVTVLIENYLKTIRSIVQLMPVLSESQNDCFRNRCARYFGVCPTSIRVHGQTDEDDRITCGIDILSGGIIVEILDP